MSYSVLLFLWDAQCFQARSDVVRLVERLDYACVRFIHFSKENELRSRVFAEKLGLEAGWNCHVSLASNEFVFVFYNQNLLLNYNLLYD